MSRKLLFTWVFMLIPAVLMGALSMDIYLPSIPHMPELLDTDPQAIQWTLSIYVFTFGICQLLYGPIADSWGRRKTMLFSLTIYAAASLVCMLSTNVEMLIVARALQGLGACGSSVVAHAMIRDALPSTSQPRAYSYLGGLIGLAPIFAPMLGAGLLLIFATWRSSFAFLAIFSLCVLFLYTLRLPETLEQPQKLKLDVWRSYQGFLSNKNFCFYSWTTAVGMACLFLYFSMSPIIYVELLDVSEFTFTIYFAINALTIMQANFVGPEIIHRYGIDKTLYLAILVIFSGGVAMVACEYLHQLSVMGFMLSMLVASFGIGLQFGATTSGAMRDFPHKAGAASALFGLFRFIPAPILGIVIMAIPIQSSLNLGYFITGISGISLVLAALHYHFIVKPKRLNKDEATVTSIEN